MIKRLYFECPSLFGFFLILAHQCVFHTVKLPLVVTVKLIDAGWLLKCLTGFRDLKKYIGSERDR